MANRFFANAGHFYAPHVMPITLDCNFVVDSTNGNGLGIRSLKGPAIANVFMHTSASPGAGNLGVINPNPASGIIMVQLSDNYYKYYGGYAGFVSPLTGSPLTSVSAHTIYVITSVGSTSQAQWQALGLAPGVTPNVGAAFIAASSGAIPGSGTVEVQGVSGIDHIEVVGDPNQTIAPVGLSVVPGTGMVLFLQCLNEGSLTAPNNNTVIGLNFYLSNSSATGGAAGS
jgi:hypothetical protein